MFTEEDIGKKVIMTREPTAQEWEGIGKVPITHLLGQEAIITGLGTFSIYVDDKTRYCYPSCCFEFSSPNYDIY